VTAQDRTALPLSGLTITAEARHPLGREKPVALTLQADGERYRSRQPLPAGRWIVALRLTRAGERFQQEGELR
jgi:nitrogen fixation protein FixH